MRARSRDRRGVPGTHRRPRRGGRRRRDRRARSRPARPPWPPGPSRRASQSLRTAVRLADRAGDAAATGHRAARAGRGADPRTRRARRAGPGPAVRGRRDRAHAPTWAAVAEIRAELGYVDFLRARYDRAERWLNDALAYADGSPSVQAKATTYLGSVASDRGDFDRARELLESAIALSRGGGRTASAGVRARDARPGRPAPGRPDGSRDVARPVDRRGRSTTTGWRSFPGLRRSSAR